METTPGLNFTAIDFEAANSDRASACSVGVTTVRDGLITGTTSWLIRPFTGLDSFDAYASRIHGIDASMVIDAQPLKDAMLRLSGIIGDGPVLAHNITYDATVLRHSFELTGLGQPRNEFRCTQTLSRAALQLEKTRLHVVTAYLGLPEFDNHDAAADSLACARIALHIAARRRASTITELYQSRGIG
ncbi:Exonuclease RNase T and DNA polymerase III (plasmid) [Pseudarthrobacter chlorophenolicus A6]|uniref:Exonuclease RNase T and DNA polymerase III n=1 Tax=Pseudarthrobacter chlorophenolicus (strain ATCC 700700 / DSM 12829 / CIP 107037 / JCM 12360 / KCTC 9906 / NCIMB 13794 / A6) TaxID=452863 RepID=B8HJ08_PSECP|nr:3'-5' exonuclease [Pseudarthrobacter chlorophenolicus]ACL42405.1 Exonuclease RNase T and DNA polymerase III [Pseudarthrobacter chlorophenolicus A6]SDQ17686.1 DNA polymerase-3 subunit epsilon [Pseudarthrobacter chlorophenolicus]